MLAVNVTVGETDEDAARLVASAKGYYARLGRAGRTAGELHDGPAEQRPVGALPPQPDGPKDRPRRKMRSRLKEKKARPRLPRPRTMKARPASDHRSIPQEAFRRGSVRPEATGGAAARD